MKVYAAALWASSAAAVAVPLCQPSNTTGSGKTTIDGAPTGIRASNSTSHTVRTTNSGNSNPSNPLLREDVVVTSADLDAMALYTQWSGATYCNSESTVGSAVRCSNSVCPTLEQHNATVEYNLGSDDTPTDMVGFVGYDPVLDQIVAAYRGSSSIRNWIANVEFVQVPCKIHLTAGLARTAGGHSCKVHDGFGGAWASLAQTTYDGIAKAASAHPTAALVVTGHSLGAAVATLAAAELRHRNYTLDLYTYGSPRVGNDVFAAFASAQGPVGHTAPAHLANYRVTHTHDPVPQLPPIGVLEYRHTTPEFWLTDDGTVANVTDAGYWPGRHLYTADDVKVCYGYSNRTCNESKKSLDKAPHVLYFEMLTECGEDTISWKKRDLAR